RGFRYVYWKRGVMQLAHALRVRKSANWLGARSLLKYVFILLLLTANQFRRTPGDLLEFCYFEVHSVKPGKMTAPVKPMVVRECDHFPYAPALAYQCWHMPKFVEWVVDIERRPERVIAQRREVPADETRHESPVKLNHPCHVPRVRPCFPKRF